MQGFSLILQTIKAMFNTEDIDNACVPLDANTFFEMVLVPEVAVLLIMEDTLMGREEAIEILKESREYGSAMFPDDEDDVDDSNTSAHGGPGIPSSPRDPDGLSSPTDPTAAVHPTRPSASAPDPFTPPFTPCGSSTPRRPPQPPNPSVGDLPAERAPMTENQEQQLDITDAPSGGAADGTTPATRHSPIPSTVKVEIMEFSERDNPAAISRNVFVSAKVEQDERGRWTCHLSDILPKVAEADSPLKSMSSAVSHRTSFTC